LNEGKRQDRQERDRREAEVSARAGNRREEQSRGTGRGAARNRRIGSAMRWCAAMMLLACAAVPAPARAQETKTDLARYLSAARKAAKEKDWSWAADNYREAAKLAPQDAALHLEYAGLLLKMGRVGTAGAVYRETLEFAPTNEAARLGSGEVYAEALNYDWARREIKLAQKQHPTSAKPWTALGRLDVEMQRYDDAAKSLERAARMDPSSAEARDWLAAAYMGLQRDDAALAEVNKTLAKHPGDARAHYLRGKIRAGEGKDAAALKDAEAALKGGLDTRETRFLLGQAAVSVNQCHEAVETLFPVMPKNAETLRLLAKAYRCAGIEGPAKETEKAAEAAEKAEHTPIADKVAAGHVVEQADALAQKGKYDEAVALLKQATEKDPTSNSAWLAMATAYYNNAEAEKSQEALNHALEIWPYNAQNQFLQAELYERASQDEEALNAYYTALAADTQNSESWYRIGFIHTMHSEDKEALAAYQQALNIAPSNAKYQEAYKATKESVEEESGEKSAKAEKDKKE
jgi:tetratricopeptide (TPR) repeat protein